MWIGVFSNFYSMSQSSRLILYYNFVCIWLLSFKESSEVDQANLHPFYEYFHESEGIDLIITENANISLEIWVVVAVYGNSSTWLMRDTN